MLAYLYLTTLICSRRKLDILRNRRRQRHPHLQSSSEVFQGCRETLATAPHHISSLQLPKIYDYFQSDYRVRIYIVLLSRLIVYIFVLAVRLEVKIIIVSRKK